LKVNQFSKRGAFHGDHHPALPSLKDAIASYAMATLLMASSCLAAAHADVKVARTQLPTPMQKLAARKFCMPTKNEAAYAASPAPLASLAPPCPLGSKKVAQLPPLSTTLVVPDPEDAASTTLELDERMARLCSKKPRKSGCGLPSAARHDRWLPMRWVIGVKGRVNGCGRPFQTAIARDSVSPTSGQRMLR
jgi:hypothetical protein